MKRFISLAMILFMLCPCVLCPAMAEDIVPYSSNFFAGYGTTLGNNGNGAIQITFSAYGTRISDKIGVATWEVEKLNDDGDWVSVTDLLPGSTGTNTSTYTFGRIFYGISGETYRVKVVFVCGYGNDFETQSYTSGRITAE